MKAFELLKKAIRTARVVRNGWSTRAAQVSKISTEVIGMESAASEREREIYWSGYWHGGSSALNELLRRGG
jgi:hypothetical protein